MKRIVTLALLLAVGLTLLCASGALAASETVIYTISYNDQTYHWLNGSDGSSYHIGVAGGLGMAKSYTAAMGDVTMTITSAGSHCFIGRYSGSGIRGFDTFDYTFTFSSATRYITNVKIRDVYNGTELSVDNNTRECTVNWDRDIYCDAQQFEVTLSDTKPVRTYAIAYELNGGVNAASNPATYSDDAATPLAAPVRTGYSFGGWYDNEGLNGSPIASIPAGSSGDVTLYAKWTINQYTLRFDACGGSAVAPITQNYGTALTAPANPTRTGYTFAGWNPALPETMPAANCVFSALWTPIQYQVSFDANGGAGYMGSYNLPYGSTSYLTYNAFSRRGYSFAGWNTAADGSGTAYQDGQSVSSLTAESGATVTLYAQWTVNQYTVTFDSNGGSAVAPITQDFGTELSAPANPTCTGYSFLFWVPKLPRLIPAENRTFKAKWLPNYYLVKFDANGGTGEAMDAQSCTYDIPIPLPANTYTREGYVFAGWNTAADGSGASYQDGQKVSNLTAVNNDIVRLYAQWRPITYTVHFEPGIPVNGEMADQVLTYDQAANLTANAFHTLIGEFLRWNTEPDGSRTAGTEYADQAEVLNLTAIDGDTVTLYARWHLMHYVNYDQDVFRCAVNGNERNWAYKGDTVKVSIVDDSREYTVAVVSASGKDLDLNTNTMTFTMPDEEVFIIYESLNKIAYTNILLDDFESWEDVAYLYDADHPIVTPAVTVTDMDENDPHPLTEGVDYTVAITGNTGAPNRLVTATVTVTGMGNYIGINEKTFRITPFNIADCDIGGRLEAYNDGYGPYYPLTRNVQVRSGSRLLTCDEDYAIELDSGIDTYGYETGRTYTATVIGQGAWGGRKTFTFLMTELYHTVVFDANGGSGEMAGSTAEAGKWLALPQCGFTAPEGKRFDQWEVSYSNGDSPYDYNYYGGFTTPAIYGESTVLTITMTACWTDLPRYDITFSDTAHGTVTVDDLTAWAGKTVIPDIQPEAGYALDTLTVLQGTDSVEVKDNAFVMPEGAVQVTATFAPVDYSITVPDNLSDVLTASAATAHVGDTITLSLREGNYVLRALTVMQGNTPVDVANNTFIMPAGNVQVNAVIRQRFRIAERANGYSHSDIVMISGFVYNEYYYAAEGDIVTFRVAPDPGYDTVSSVSVNNYTGEPSVDVTDLGGNMYSFVMPDYDAYVSATCEGIHVEIPTGHGKVTVEPENPAEGETVTLTAVPDAGYMLSTSNADYIDTFPVTARTVYGEAVEVNWDWLSLKRFIFTMPSSGVTVTAAFEEGVYNLFISYSKSSVDVKVNGGTAEINQFGAYDIRPGQSVTLTFSPNPGFELVEIRGNYYDDQMQRYPFVITQDAGNPLVFTFTVPDYDVYVEADFTPVFGTPDFILPASLNTIGESAFEGVPLLQIVDAGSVTAIGKWAFRDSGIRQIRLPRDCQIDADAFDGCGEVYVFAPAGGTTEAFCSSHRKVTFVEIQ